MSLGVLHLALLPLSLDESLHQQQQAQHSTICKPPAPHVPPAATAAPLLMTQLLVLPAAAAQELQQHWQQAAAAAAADAANNLGEPWKETVAALTTDIAYLLATCKAPPAAAAAADGKIASGVAAVLQQLLAHLAACGMWAAMQVLVECATEYAAAPAAAAPIAPVAEAATSSTPCAPSANDSNTAVEPTTAAPAASIGAAQSADRTPAGTVVTASSLLWGFEDQQLEDSYQAAAFSSTGPLDVASLVYSAVMASGCYYARGGSSSNQQQQLGVSPGFLIWSHLLVLCVVVAGPAAVLVLRWRVARKLQLLAQQQQQQQDTQGSDKPSRSVSSTLPANSSSSSAHDALAAAELAAAGRMKQRLMCCWALVVLALLLLVLLGGSLLIVEPHMITRYWQQRGVAEDLGLAIGFALEKYVWQVSCKLLSKQLLFLLWGGVSLAVRTSLMPRWQVRLRL
jgi:hypothetical protein